MDPAVCKWVGRRKKKEGQKSVGHQKITKQFFLDILTIWMSIHLVWGIFVGFLSLGLVWFGSHIEDF
jgi:hypothetical protein